MFTLPSRLILGYSLHLVYGMYVSYVCRTCSTTVCLCRCLSLKRSKSSKWRLEGPGDREGGRRGEDLAADDGGEEALTDHAGVRGLMAATATAQDGHSTAVPVPAGGHQHLHLGLKPLKSLLRAS